MNRGSTGLLLGSTLFVIHLIVYLSLELFERFITYEWSQAHPNAELASIIIPLVICFIAPIILAYVYSLYSKQILNAITCLIAAVAWFILICAFNLINTYFLKLHIALDRHLILLSIIIIEHLALLVFVLLWLGSKIYFLRSTR